MPVNTSVRYLLIYFLSTSGNKKIGPERVRLTLDEVRGTPLADKTKPLSEYIKGDSAVLYFKDLGMQVSWTTVFLVEYFGPILITLLLIFF